LSAEFVQAAVTPGLILDEPRETVLLVALATLCSAYLHPELLALLYPFLQSEILDSRDPHS
jgi:hypothetical protein